MYMYIHYIVRTHTVWSAVGVKIVFKISVLCGEYITRCIYKCVDVFINIEKYLLIVTNSYIFTNTTMYLFNTAMH